MRTRCGLGGEAPEHAASENNHPQIRLSCMAVRDAASAPNQDDRSDAVPGPSRPSLAASRVECVSVGPRETSPDYPSGAVYSGSVESFAFFGLQRCTQCREGERYGNDPPRSRICRAGRVVPTTWILLHG